LENYTENNQVDISGLAAEDPSFSHEIFGEGFYVFSIDIERLSGAVDKIPVLFSERLIGPEVVKKDKVLHISGQFRSYNVTGANDGHRLKLLVFAREITEVEDDFKYRNEITLDGFVCKKPVYRTTPFGREITDLLFAVNRSYNKSDYLPCVVWGRNAKFCSEFDVGTRIKITGRIQSRDYEKKFRDGTSSKRTAYEVSVNTVEVVEQSGT
jgi:primosomal replication protein N